MVKLEFKTYPNGSWEDWSRHLATAPTISKRVESEEAGEAGLVVYDNTNIELYYKDGTPAWTYFHKSLTTADKYLFRISLRTQSGENRKFEGLADFESIEEDEVGATISFSLMDKLTSMDLIQAELPREQNIPIFSRCASEPEVDQVVMTANDGKLYVDCYTATSELRDCNENAFAPGEILPNGDEGYVVVKSFTRVYDTQQTPYHYRGIIECECSDELSSTSFYDNGGELGWSKNYLGKDITILDAGVAVSLDAIEITNALFSNVWDGSIINNTGSSTFPIALNYVFKLLDENPFETHPLDALKFLASSMQCYIFVNSNGDLVIQSRSYAKDNGIVRSIGSTKIYTKRKRPFWDKLVDEVEIRVNSWVKNDDGNYLEGSYKLQKNPNIKARNPLTKEVLAIDNVTNTQELLDTYAASMASDYFNFYGKRHENYILELNYDDNTEDWELLDVITINGYDYFFDAITIDAGNKTISLEPVSSTVYDYDLSTAHIAKSQAEYLAGSSGSSSSSSSSSGTFVLGDKLTALQGMGTEKGVLVQIGDSDFTKRKLLGTENQIIVTDAVGEDPNTDGTLGDFVIKLPQDYHTAAQVQLGNLGLGCEADESYRLKAEGNVYVNGTLEAKEIVPISTLKVGETANSKMRAEISGTNIKQIYRTSGGVDETWLNVGVNHVTIAGSTNNRFGANFTTTGMELFHKESDGSNTSLANYTKDEVRLGIETSKHGIFSSTGIYLKDATANYFYAAGGVAVVGDDSSHNVQVTSTSVNFYNNSSLEGFLSGDLWRLGRYAFGHIDISIANGVSFDVGGYNYGRLYNNEWRLGNEYYKNLLLTTSKIALREGSSEKISIESGLIKVGEEANSSYWLDVSSTGVYAKYRSSGGSTSTPFYISSYGQAYFSGQIMADTGYIGGWNILSGYIAGNDMVLDANGIIRMGSMLNYATGNGLWFGNDSSTYKFAVGNSSTNKIFTYDGNQLRLNNGIITGISSGSEIAIQGWQHNLSFSSSSYNTITYTSGQIYLLDGTIFNISGNTWYGITGTLYIYFEDTTPTILKSTYTSSLAVGSGKILVAVCKPTTSGKEAVFQVFGGNALGGVGKLVVADNIAANTITANEIDVNYIYTNTLNASQITAGYINSDRIQANSISSAKLSVTTLSAISADLGTVTAGTITGLTITGGVVQTSTSGSRVVMSESNNSLEIYNSQGRQIYIGGNLIQLKYTSAPDFATTITPGYFSIGSSAGGPIIAVFGGASGTTPKFYVSQSYAFEAFDDVKLNNYDIINVGTISASSGSYTNLTVIGTLTATITGYLNIHVKSGDPAGYYTMFSAASPQWIRTPQNKGLLPNSNGNGKLGTTSNNWFGSAAVQTLNINNIYDQYGNKVLGSQQPAIADVNTPTVYNNTDKINAILSMLRTHGLIAS